MRRIPFEDNWPQSWRYSYPFDLLEVYGEKTRFGYFYAYQARREVTLRLITEVLKPGARILDVAAAQGNFSLALAELGFEVTWNDLREDLAGYVQLKHERGTIQYAPGNVLELQFPVLFDGILLTEVIEHVARPDELLTKVGRLVRPGGYVVMTTPNGRYFRNRLPRFRDCPDPGAYERVQFKPDADGHIFLLHPDEIPPLADAAQLEVEVLSLFTNPLTQGHLKTEILLRLLPAPVVTALERATRRLPRGAGERILFHMAARFRRRF